MQGQMQVCIQSLIYLDNSQKNQFTLSFISTAHYLQTKQVLAFPVKHFFQMKKILIQLSIL